MKNSQLQSLFFIFLSSFPAFLVFSCGNGTYEHGKILYQNFCSNCHIDDGTGLAGLIPPLADADFVKNNPGQLPCIIYQGIKGEMLVNGKVYNSEMAGVPQLTEFEITNIINYINTAWGNNFPVVKHQMVKEALVGCGYDK